MARVVDAPKMILLARIFLELVVPLDADPLVPAVLADPEPPPPLPQAKARATVAEMVNANNIERDFIGFPPVKKGMPN